MLILNKFDAERIRHQPSILTYHNLANVCALAESPRIIIDTDNGVNAYWAANMPIEDCSISVPINFLSISVTIKKIHLQTINNLSTINKIYRCNLLTEHELRFKNYIQIQLTVLR